MSTVTVPEENPAAELTDDPVGLVAAEFLHTVCNLRQVQTAFQKYVGDRYVQHNPMVPDGVEGGLAFLTAVVESSPDLAYHLKRVATNGDIAMLHSHVSGLSVPEWQNGVAVVDIFRVENGKLVEHWDVVQPLPDDPANENGMF